MVDTVVPTLVMNGPAEGFYSPPPLRSPGPAIVGMSGVAGYIYRLDGKDWTEMGNEQIAHLQQVSVEGLHLVEVRVFDMSGELRQGQRELHRGHGRPVRGDQFARRERSTPTPPRSRSSGPGATRPPAIQGYRYQLDSDDWSGLTNRLHPDIFPSVVRG